MAKIRKITVDQEGRSAYVYLEDIAPGGAKKQVVLSDGLILDFSEDWHLLGIEILDARLASGLSGEGLRLRLKRAGIEIKDL